MFLSGSKRFNDDVASPTSSLGSYAGSLTAAREDSSLGLMGKLAAWREQDGKKHSPMTSSSVSEVSHKRSLVCGLVLPLMEFED